jgi:hypothetical protein
MTTEMELQLEEGRRREAAALSETAAWRRFISEIDEDGNQQYVSWGDIPVELADDPEEQAGSPEYLALLDEMKSLHIRKNAGYAGVGNVDPWANFRMSEGFGVDTLRGVLVRLSDKYIRVQNLLRDPNNEQVGESIDDTLMDLSAYALIAICVRRQAEQEPAAESQDERCTGSACCDTCAGPVCCADLA